MNENRTIHLVDIPIGGKDGFVWNRLHEQRESICEAMLKELDPIPQAVQRRELLQSRLRRIDDALDRLMSGAYGICSKCGRPIEPARLDVDPARFLCSNCGSSKGKPGSEIIIPSLAPFDTILLQTHNSGYRILLLDPQTGRALVEGGQFLVEPSEAVVMGSLMQGSEVKGGSICVGHRLEIRVNDRVLVTSPVKAVEVKHNAPAESAQSLSEALH